MPNVKIVEKMHRDLIDLHQQEEINARLGPNEIEIIREIFRIVAHLRDLGVSVLLVEQNARAALQVADYGYVLETGEMALENDSKALADDPRVIESYLGLGGKH